MVIISQHTKSSASSAVIYLKVIVVYAFIVSFYVPYIDYDSTVHASLPLFLLSTVVLYAAAEMATMAF